MAIFFNFAPTSSHVHPLLVDEDDNGKYRIEMVKSWLSLYSSMKTQLDLW